MVVTRDRILLNYGGQAGDVFTINTATAATIRASFDTAITALEGAGGGRLTVLPGSVRYVLDQGLLVTGPLASGLEWEMLPGVEIQADTSFTEPVLDILNVENVKVSGGKFRDLGGRVNDRRLLRLRATSDGANDRAIISGVWFQMLNANDGATGVEYIGNGSSGSARARDLSIEGCRFTFSNSPSLILGIRVTNTEVYGIRRCTFGGDSTLQIVAEVDGIILAKDSFYGAVDSNCFRNINGNYLIRLQTDAASEGGHSIIADNIFEGGTLDYDVWIEGADFTAIRGNNFGRQNSALARVFVDDRTDGATRVRAITIQNNDFHVSTGDAFLRYGIHLNRAEGVLVDGNTYYNMHGRGIFLRVESDCLRVKFNPNTQLVLPEPAITENDYQRTEWADAETSEVVGNVYPDPVTRWGNLSGEDLYSKDQ